MKVFDSRIADYLKETKDEMMEVECAMTGKRVDGSIDVFADDVARKRVVTTGAQGAM